MTPAVITDPGTLLERLQQEAQALSEHDLAEYFNTHRNVIVEILAAHPRQPETADREQGNPFLYTMR